MANNGIVHSFRLDVAARVQQGLSEIDFKEVGLPRRLPDEIRLLTGPAEPSEGYQLGVRLTASANAKGIGGEPVPEVTQRQYMQVGESQAISATHIVFASTTAGTVWDIIYHNLPERSS